MGVPSFFRWLLEKYPRVIKYVKEEFIEYDDNGERILPDPSGKNVCPKINKTITCYPSLHSQIIITITIITHHYIAKWHRIRQSISRYEWYNSPMLSSRR